MCRKIFFNKYNKIINNFYTNKNTLNPTLLPSINPTLLPINPSILILDIKKLNLI